MKLLFPVLLLVAAVSATAAEPEMQLPVFPLPAVVLSQGVPRQVSALRLLRELHNGGIHGTPDFETNDLSYALLRSDSLDTLVTWLDATCDAFGIDLTRARERGYDGRVLGHLLGVATSLASVRERRSPLAVPIGIISCRRDTAWGALPADHAEDAYVLFATDAGMFVYDPPTRQFAALADFPNKFANVSIRF